MSNGIPDKNNLHSDANKIFSYTKSFLSKNNYNSKIIVMGRSLGSASACEIISNYQDELSGCIIESGFGTEIPLMKILDLTPTDLNYSTSDGFENLNKLIGYTKPILIIHSEDDNIIPINEAKLMYKKVGSNQKDLWIIKNANHNNILIQSPKEYFLRIKKFISNLA